MFVPQPLEPTAVLYSANGPLEGTVEQVISPVEPPTSFEPAPACTNRLPGSVSEPVVTAPPADSVENRTFSELAGPDVALYEMPYTTVLGSVWYGAANVNLAGKTTP